MEPFNAYLRPLGKNWNKHAEKVHEISRKRAEKFPHPSEVAADLKAWIEEFDCVFHALGHNCKNDKNYLDRLIADYGLINEWNSRVQVKWKDTLTIAKSKKSIIPTKNHKLETLCNFFKIEIDAHNALSDALGTLDLYEKMTGLIAANAGPSLGSSGMTNVEKRKKYIDMKYVTIGSDGCVFITEFGTQNKEALATILEHLWSIYVSDEV